jgi:DNA polymerase-3 subunit alpha
MKYRRRIAYEREIIEEKDGYIDYFLAVADVVRFAKDAGIPVGPARGSAAASLVCWLLRITEVDPMRFPNMVFERFIDRSRADMPDVDLDFASEGRPALRKYLEQRYGDGCVGNIGTFTYFRAKLALDDVARVHRIPKWEVEKVKEMLLERSSGDLRASATIEDTIEQFDEVAQVFERHPELRASERLEGMVRGHGIHAAGMIIANGSILQAAPLLRRIVAKETREVVGVDKYDAEHLGMLKMDLLGLSTMSVFATALEWLDKPLDYLYNIPLVDEKIQDGFRRNDVTGIFQYDGRAVRTICGSLQPDTFKEVCDINALARPGPLHNGAATEYIDMKRKVKDPHHIHPLLDDITKDTHFQIVYQEQILRIVTEIGGFDWTAASYIRKIISKKIGDAEFNRQWGRFLDGALSRGVTEAEAKEIWGLCITAGSYAFNAAHSVSYGMIAWWCMWLKQYHPAVFYAASLRHLGKGDPTPGAEGSGVGMRHMELLRDAKKHQIQVRMPDPARSGESWMPVHGRAIRAGLIQVPGIGPKTAEAALALSPRVKQWRDMTRVKGIGPKTVQKIVDWTEQEDPMQIDKLGHALRSTRKWLKTGQKDSSGAWLPEPTHTSLQVPYERGPDVDIVWVGQAVHRNLRDLFEHNRARTGVELDPSQVRDPELREWVIMLGQDEDELVTITVDRFKYPAFREMLWKIRLGHDLLLVQGKKRGFRAARAVYVDRMWVLEP